VSDLGQFDFANGRLRLTSRHPGITLQEVQANTGFPLEVAPDLEETTPPTEEEVRLLREEIDPSGVRRLECLSGQARWLALWEIIKREKYPIPNIQIETRRLRNDNEVNFGRPGNHELG
jgi:hypothetical protein